MMTRDEAFSLVRLTAAKWSEHQAPRLGASLAYYALLSMAPLLILTVALCGLVFSRSTAEANLLAQVRQIAGDQGVSLLHMLLNNVHHAKSGLTASIVAIVTLLFGASGVFLELRDSLNTIWDAPPARATNWKHVLWQRAVAFVMVVSLGILLLVSLILSAGLGILVRFFNGLVPVHIAMVGTAANFLLSLVGMSVLFGLVFKFVPDVPIQWRDVGVGAVATAVLFSIGRALLALYLGTAGIGSAYGAAGSVVAFVVWIYYSAQIFFFGAIFTRCYSSWRMNKSQSRRPPPLASKHAVSGTS
jgi:membrane protein